MNAPSIGIYGPTKSGKTSLLTKLKIKKVEDIEEYSSDILPQPGHRIIIVMCTRNIRYWRDYMDSAVEIYPINSVLPIVTTADKKETIGDRIKDAPLGVIGVDARPKYQDPGFAKLTQILSGKNYVSTVQFYIDSQYSAVEKQEKLDAISSRNRERRQKKKERKNSPNEEGWIQV